MDYGTSLGITALTLSNGARFIARKCVANLRLVCLVCLCLRVMLSLLSSRALFGYCLLLMLMCLHSDKASNSHDGIMGIILNST